MTSTEARSGSIVRATLELPSDGAPRAVEWGGPLTPYVVEEIVDDAMHAGAGASLDVRVAGSTADQWLARLEQVSRRLCARGIEVHLRRATLTAEGLQ